MAGPGTISLLERNALGCPLGFQLDNFETGSADLKLEHRNFLLDRVVRILRNGRSRASIVGRASQSGTAVHNRDLSRRRADAVREFLVGEGVEAARLAVRFVGERQPLSFSPDSATDRSVEIHLTIELDPTFVIVLANGNIVRPTPVLVTGVTAAYGPLAAAAGRTLSVVTSSDPYVRFQPLHPLNHGTADIVLPFTRASGEPFGPGSHHAAFGIEGGGVLVDVREDQRVGGPMRLAPSLSPALRHNPGQVGQRFPARWQVDFSNQVDLPFVNGEAAFATAVANTAVHELAHILGLEHVCDDIDNYMFTSECGRQGVPFEQRSRINVIDFWSRPKHFTDEQRRALICAIATGRYARDGLSATSAPAGRRVANPLVTPLRSGRGGR
jgi:hypothetical protein